MIRFKWLWMFALATSLFTTACNTDDLNPDLDADHTQMISMLSMGGGNGGGSDCYEVVYPISFILPNGNEKVAENEGQMSGLLHANPGPIQIVFPITLIDEDGNEIIVENEDDLQMYLDLCSDDDDDLEDIFGDDLFDCYSIQYPIDVELSDTTIATVNDEDELIALFDDAPYPVAPVFPITLIDEDGNPVTAADLNALFDLAADCDDDDDDWELGDLECYELGYPIEILLEDSTTAVANDPDELALILTGSPAPVDFVFPIILIDEDGNEVPVNDPDELDDLIDDCEDDGDGCSHGLITSFLNTLNDLDQGEACYDLVYPLTFVLANGNEDTVNDQAELEDYLDMPGSFPQVKCVVFPVEVTDEDSGDLMVAETPEDLHDLVVDCDN
ncbi:MAG: hypothetical protein GYB31_19440 [Bacteroidetes bacterium]|nr:hypothetical protein [Bacteroidota bacterium]